jgi:hypothetical protein
VQEWENHQQDPALNPPPGTGTVADSAGPEDKSFYTIMTDSGAVFYLIIDRRFGRENVYFLNPVTELDLLALVGAEMQPAPMPQPSTMPPPTEPMPEHTPEAEPAPQPENGNTGTFALVAVVVLGGGAAGWYLKIYKPKQNVPDESELEDFDIAEADSYDDYEDTEPETTWDEDEADPTEVDDYEADRAYNVDEIIREVRESEVVTEAQADSHEEEPTYDVDEIIHEVQESEPETSAMEATTHDKDETYDWAKDLVDEIIRKVRESEGYKT